MEHPVRYEVVEHTADTGITAYGKDTNEIFENAAYGMFDLMTDVRRVRLVGEVRLEVEAHDLGSLLVDWLSELLFIHEAENVFFAEFDVELDDLTLTGRARGEEVDPERHRLQTQIKAVTYHMLEVNPEEGYATVILDI
jgi:SHS2 domain-containing protein